MYDAIFHGKDLGDAKTSCLLPVVLDSYGAYTILVYLLRKMVDGKRNFLRIFQEIYSNIS